MRASVVITTHNRRLIVPDAVESALSQSVEEIEVIVVDDGSADGTADELTRRFGHDPRLRIVRRPNGGPPAARNTGLDAAVGPYLALLDSDDLWRPEHLASQLKVLQENPEADMVLDNGLCNTPSGKPYLLFERPQWVFPHTIEDMCKISYLLPSFSVFRTPVLRELRFDENFRLCDDTELLWRFLANGHHSVENARTLAEYRVICEPGGQSAAQLTCDEDTILLTQYDIWKRYRSQYPQALERGSAMDRDLAELLLRHDRPKEARWHAERLAQTAPDDPDAIRLLQPTSAKQ
ncbi:MAG: glycosyltransferase [Propionibacteriaceae bacterium]|jgi:glycosyltransferase involved in cell wall biosynthesis|nr:glycosyltransferase [Propionibacteriaceae bacterium]